MLSLLASFSIAVAVGTSSSVSPFPYNDVPPGAWYRAVVEAMVQRGVLDASKTRFRPASAATRAEFLALALKVLKRTPGPPPLLPSFDDVPADDWAFGPMEEAAKEGWIRGDNSCYGTHPCRARPTKKISRAEAAVLLVRIFPIDPTGKAPSSIDVDPKGWYAYGIQAAADHCILKGDGDTGLIRPHDPVNRAEMAVMMERAGLGLVYGKDCGK